MSLVETEHVLVVPTELLHELGYFQGFCGEPERYLEALRDPANASYRPRGEMEQDPSFKQLIPYVVFRHTAEDGTVSVFTYTRGKGQGERRLHAKKSVGVGGHISREDAAGRSAHPYDEGLQREMDEEVEIDTPSRWECVGLINDDETEVGRVHLGVVHLVTVGEPNVRPREADLLDAGFVPVATLLAELEGFETWSQITLRTLFGQG